MYISLKNYFLLKKLYFDFLSPRCCVNYHIVLFYRVKIYAFKNTRYVSLNLSTSLHRARRWRKSDRSALPRDNNAFSSSCMVKSKQPICRPVLFFYTIFNPIRRQGRSGADSADQPLAGIMVSCSHPAHPCHAKSLRTLRSFGWKG